MLFKLAQAQKKLNSYINKNQKVINNDLYEKKKLALLVELGELANELQFFKYWKVNNEPKFDNPCEVCHGRGAISYGGTVVVCTPCEGTGRDTSKNPALEEYVDVLHFLLTVTLDKFGDNAHLADFLDDIKPLAYPDEVSQFSALYYEIASGLDTRLDLIWRYFLGLAEIVGFTDDMLEEAYFQKNKINFERQANEY